MRLHSAIAGEPIGKDTFRRWVLGQLIETDAYKPGLIGKPRSCFGTRSPEPPDQPSRGHVGADSGGMLPVELGRYTRVVFYYRKRLLATGLIERAGYGKAACAIPVYGNAD
ncbi:hypothetical protein [Cryobacterium sp. Hh38]|uniref:hypothetical protein n=1 Tax=Cryobacterium sp. Hh38 TaxID=1259156 RepID=UPI00141BB765|nr:hypothetical protein [Cryobacterium sp. Hh38]